MIEVKQGQRTWVPIRFFNSSTNVPIQGIVYSDVTVLVVKGDTTEVAYTASNGDLVEHSTAPANEAGLYQLRLLSSDTDVSGSLLYVARTSTSLPHVGSIKVVVNEEADTYARLGAPTGASISYDISNIAVTVTGSVVGDLSALSSSLRTEILTNRDVLSSSLVTLSSSLRDEALAASTATQASINASITTLSGTLYAEMVQVENILSGTMVNVSASLRSEVLAGSTATQAGINASIVTLSGSLRNEELQTRTILSGTMVNVSASLWLETAAIGTSINAAITSVSSSLGQQLTRLRLASEGRWKIHTTGPDANRMVFYAADDVTELFKVNLLDSSGNPTTGSPFERVPV